MTFKELKRFAERNNLETDHNSIKVQNFRLFESGFIWMNTHSLEENCMSVSCCLASNRTISQMKKFIESLI